LQVDSIQEEHFGSILDEIQTTVSFSAFSALSRLELFPELAHLEFRPSSVSCSQLRSKSQMGWLPNQKRLLAEQRLPSDGQLELSQFPLWFRQIHQRAFLVQIDNFELERQW